jgi:hypothetical protein
MCLLCGTNWVFASEKTAFFIVPAVETSNLTLSFPMMMWTGRPMVCTGHVSHKQNVNPISCWRLYIIESFMNANNSGISLN